ncbi:hypothetical protein ACFWZY_01630 [Streptomyces sp. NPDC058992]|uniref:hypothetical protein n=1 Tax=Streptomyces sp. NPDC058992 TaxID=3346688 RepID=UPI00367EA683
MTDQPITPTRIIPAGAALPARPPDPDDVPPWRAPAPAYPAAHPNPNPPGPRPGANPPPPHSHPAPGSAPAEPGVIEVRVAYDPYPTAPDPAPSWWDRLTAIAPVWKLALVLALALAPIPGVGHSIATVWAYTVGEAREFGIPHAYALALAPLLLSGRAFTRTRSLRSLFVLAVALVGLTGAVEWFDLITALTGVHPR